MLAIPATHIQQFNKALATPAQALAARPQSVINGGKKSEVELKPVVLPQVESPSKDSEQQQQVSSPR